MWAPPRTRDTLTALRALDRCGRNAGRWAALAAAMNFQYDDEKITFGQLLDSLDAASADAQTS
ncbi:hypothetical protein ACWGK1_07925 [Streptomyces wedmorensis]